jgi:trehalose-phosphatase
VTTAAALAMVAARAPKPLLVGLDIDGTLSTIVEHPSRAELADGAADALAALEARPDVVVVVVSGRSYADVAHQFGFPSGVAIVGSHGLEDQAGAVMLDRAEARRRSGLRSILEPIVESTPGAWLEDKPAGVAFHHRESDPVVAGVSVQRIHRLMSKRPGVFVLSGHDVIEAMVRRPSKATALVQVRSRVGASTILYAGDDRTDEEAFVALGTGDISVKVGLGATAAHHRLAGPSDVVDFLVQLAAS